MSDWWKKPINNDTSNSLYRRQPSTVPAVPPQDDITKTTQPYGEHDHWPQNESGEWMPKVGGLANPAYANNPVKFPDNDRRNADADDYIDGPAFTNTAADAALSTRQRNLETYAGNWRPYETTESGHKHGYDEDREYLKGYINRYYPYYPYYNERGEGGYIDGDTFYKTIKEGLKSRHPDWTDTQLDNAGTASRVYYDFNDTDKYWYNPNKESTQNIAAGVQGVM